MEDGPVVIVGAGLAGLTCARRLAAEGREALVLEASDSVGGRVRTDEVEGYRLDRGFQVLLSAYPACRQWLDYETLGLGRFLPGARVRLDGAFHHVADPFRSPGKAMETMRAPIGGLGDKLRIGLTRSRVSRTSTEDLFRLPERSTEERLRELGFSDRMIDGFFRRFFGGIFLESGLSTSSRMFEFVFRMFSIGYACLPTGGMARIPEQLAAALPPGSIRLKTRVLSVEDRVVHLDDGGEIQASAVVVATDSTTAATWLPDVADPGSRGVTCLYYAAESAPVTEPVLMLGDPEEGPIHNLCFPSQVAEGYAPSGRSLVSVTVLEDRARRVKDLETAVESQFRDWFGPSTASWKLLRRYDIRYALPRQDPPALDPPARSVCSSEGPFVCGDHREHASLEGAMASGERAAEAVLGLPA